MNRQYNIFILAIALTSSFFLQASETELNELAGNTTLNPKTVAKLYNFCWTYSSPNNTTQANNKNRTDLEEKEMNPFLETVVLIRAVETIQKNYLSKKEKNV